MTWDLTDFERHIDVQFDDKNLLKQSLTHRSYVNEQPEDVLKDNERLEFLGDAVLDFITADMLFRRFPDMAEGELTRLRSALVRTEALAELARACNIGQYLLIGKGEENSGGRERTNNLCRAFEALIGAMYLDQGLETVRAFVEPQLTELQKRVIEAALHKDARSQLQEWSQAELNITPIYRLTDTSGPDHAREFEIAIVIGEQIIALGTGKSKRSAAQSAARNALNLIKSGEVTVSGETPQEGD